MPNRITLYVFCTWLVTTVALHPNGHQKRVNYQSAYPGLPAVGMVKVHKAASSTLLKILQRFYFQEGKNIMYPSDCQFLGWPGSFPGSDNIVQIGTPQHQYDLIGDHSVWNGPAWSAYLKPMPVFVLLAREPSAQAVSAYNFFKMRYPHNQREMWPHHLDWLEDLQQKEKTFKASREYARFLNPQSWDMGWYEFVGMTNEFDDNDTVIDAWLKDLDQYFGEMGSAIMLENFDEGLVLLARRLKVNIQEFSYVLQNDGKRNDYPNTHQEHRIEKLYHVDRRYHEHFNNTFYSHWEAAAGSSRDSELQMLRDHGAELQEVCDIQIHCPLEWTLEAIPYTRHLRRVANR